MSLRVWPGALQGSLRVPASKSDVHRALIASALADGPTSLPGLPASQDIRATVLCMQALGMRLDGDTVYPITVPPQTATLPCGESGATLRMLLPMAAALGVRAQCIGGGSLPRRPLAPLLQAMAANGAAFEGAGLPLAVSGRLHAGEYALPGHISSQFISGLLMALPLLAGESVIRLTTPLASAGYVRMTLDTLQKFGIRITPRQAGFFVPGSQRYSSPGQLVLAGDWSSAALWLAAGALGGDVAVTGLRPDSTQPDRALLHHLAAFGARVDAHGGRVRVRGGTLRGITADIADTPDLGPVLAVLGACAGGTTRIEGAGRLRIKESDRLDSLCALLRAVGAEAVVQGDTLLISGGRPLCGAMVDGHNDHRIVMAAAVLALRCDGPVAIRGAQAVDKSYPGFWHDFKTLGGHCDGVDDR